MIREATPGDADLVAKRLGGLPLLARYGMSPADLARRLREAMARGDGVLVACDESGPIGFAWFLAGGTFALGGYLRLIAVAPEHQSKSLGAALLGEVEPVGLPHPDLCRGASRPGRARQKSRRRVPHAGPAGGQGHRRAQVTAATRRRG